MSRMGKEGSGLIRRTNDIPRIWALIGMVAAVAVGTVATIGWLSVAIGRGVAVHNGQAGSHQHHDQRYVRKDKLEGAVQKALEPTSKRLDNIERQQQAQWRVLRQLLTGDRRAARRALRENDP